MNTNEWKVVGRFVALLVTLYSIVAECFKEAKVSLEILDWLSKDGKQKLQEVVKSLISKYKESLTPGVEIFLTFVKKISVSALPSKKTSACFTNKKRYAHRDAHLDDWLPEYQKAEAKGMFDVRVFEKPAIFKRFLDFQIGKETMGVAELSRELKSRGYTTTLTRIESLIDEQESGVEDTGLVIDGLASLFLILDTDGDICVVNVRRHKGLWHVVVERLYYLYYQVEWPAGCRLFFRN